MLLVQFAALLALPRPAVAAPSADPSKEIVYIDANGVIHVLDTQGEPLVEWFSPTGGWEYIDAGDVNADGDMEILAMKEDGGSMTVAVFDPVVYKGATDPNKKINGLPWDTLYEATSAGVGKFIKAGDFDTGIPGDEFALGWRDASHRYFVQVWKGSALGNDGKPTGRSWAIHLTKDYPNQYSVAASGQLNGSGAEELVLVDTEFTKDVEKSGVDVYQVDADMLRLDGQTSDSFEYRHAAVGQIIKDGREEVAVILEPDSSRPSLIVYETNSDSELDTDEDWQWTFSPQPEFVFLADIAGNGDQEVFFLREHEDRSPATLIMRDDWGDDRERHPDIEVNLSGDSSYGVGAGGDVDGDGKDEVVVMRDNNIRVFMRPDNNVDRSADIKNYPVSSNEKSLLVVDLDTNGFIEGPSFATDISTVEASVPIGTKSGNYAIFVTNQGTTEPLTFNAVKPASDTWVTVNPVVATTPGVINVSFDATNLKVGAYRSTLTLTSAANVLNQPYTIELILNVEPATITPSSSIVQIFHEPCTAPLTAMTETIKIGGTNDLKFVAGLMTVPTDTVTVATFGSLQGPITGGYVDAGGSIVVSDAAGNRQTIPAASDVSASAALSASLPIDPSLSWLDEVSFDTLEVPANLTVKADLTTLGADFDPRYAVIVLVADTRAGLPPDNVTILPIMSMCADGKALAPSVYR
jgi:hypothetical protein